jgi:methylglutaconyl-CoA hydratase
MYETIRIDHDTRGVATIWLNRPEKHNVMSGLMMTELGEAAKVLGADSGVRVVVMGGNRPQLLRGWGSGLDAGANRSRR